MRPCSVKFHQNGLLAQLKIKISKHVLAISLLHYFKAIVGLHLYVKYLLARYVSTKINGLLFGLVELSFSKLKIR